MSTAPTTSPRIPSLLLLLLLPRDARFRGISDHLISSSGPEGPGTPQGGLTALAMLLEVRAEAAQRAVGIEGQLVDREGGGERVAAAPVAAVVEARHPVVE